MSTKRVLIVSDLHCGHIAGITHPAYMSNITSQPEVKRDRIRELSRLLWRWFSREVDKLRPFRLVICNGDAIDGRGEKSGGTELLLTDRNDQVDMATACLKHIAGKGSDILMTYGTGYHTGKEEDFERQIADKLGCKIGGHEWPEVNGCILDVKHKINFTIVPLGIPPLQRDKVHNYLWCVHQEQPNADIIVRSHVHAFTFTGNSDYLGFTTPGLQAPGTKFGSRECSRHVDFGFVYLDIKSNGGYEWHPVIARLEQAKARTTQY